MGKIKLFSVILLCLSLYSCETKQDSALGEKAKTAIGQAEKDFAKMAAEKGIAEAFEFYADSNATIRRGRDSLIHGKEGIRNFYSADYYKTAAVTWSPDFIDASPDGEMGYTYGKYNWQSKDSSGRINEAKGIFHTVWKKQKDGSWKYVWD